MYGSLSGSCRYDSMRRAKRNTLTKRICSIGSISMACSVMLRIVTDVKPVAADSWGCVKEYTESMTTDSNIG
jgi:hypothetical protein